MISQGRVIRIGLFFAIANFLIAIGIGILLRYHYMSPIPLFPDRYWIHAHSHIGFLGWVFMALITMAFAVQCAKSSGNNRRMYRLLIYLQLSVFGMLITFPFMGYAAPSIFFSTIHMVLSIVFVVFFFRNTDATDLSVKFMRAGLIFMLISSMGPLALGPMMVMGMKGTPLYDMSVYFYLHFQYNAWFTLAIFGLFMKLLENLGFPVQNEKGRKILNLLIFASILTFALSALGFESFWYVRGIGFLGALLQLWAGFIFLVLVFKNVHMARSASNSFALWFFGVALFAWLLKIMMQFISVIPVVTDFAYFNREAIMSYLHLSFLGFASCFLIGLMIIRKYLVVTNRIARIGYIIFFVGIVSMEITLGIKSFPRYLSIEGFRLINASLFLEAAFIFVSIVMILFYGFIIPKRKLKLR